MKTKLVINDDLKSYLYKEIDRSSEESEVLSNIFKRENFDWQWLFKFSDKHGASVIKSCCGSWGFDNDLFELATVYFYEEDKHVLCDLEGIDETPIGYLTNDDVMELLYKVKNIIKGDAKDEN